MSGYQQVKSDTIQILQVLKAFPAVNFVAGPPNVSNNYVVDNYVAKLHMAMLASYRPR